MDIAQRKYKKYGLIEDMFESVELSKNTNLSIIEKFAGNIKSQKLFFTGEGSSEIFPGHNAVYNLLRRTSKITAVTDSAMQASEYDLSNYTVFAASNSGRTKEVINLIKNLQRKNHRNIIAVTSYEKSPLTQLVKDTYILSCGPERATAATKSVVEEALFYEILIKKITGLKPPDFNKFAGLLKSVLQMKIPKKIIEKTAEAETIYFAGRNNGVAEELRLKANEIVRKKSDFLVGTYVVHGVEEAMTGKDVLIIINPFPQEEEKVAKVIVKAIGVPVFAISHRQSFFPTVLLPEYSPFAPYLQLAAGWNLLVEAGLLNNIDLDHPHRARKIGNELEA